MNRTQKTAEIENLKSQFSKSIITILADYKGLSVDSLTDLRGKLRERDSSFKVVKNRLARIAIKDMSIEELEGHFVGTTAIAVSESDPAGPAKVLSDFAKDNEKLKIKVGFLNGKVLDLKEIKALGNLPSKEELIAKMMSSMQAPASNLVSVLSQVPRQLVTVLGAVKSQKETNA